MDNTLIKEQFDISSFRKKIEAYKPTIVCFNGKKAGQEYMDSKSISYGLQDQRIGKTRLFVAPSTSGSANGYWDEKYWF